MPKRIGEFFVEKGILTEAEVHEILDYSKTKNLRFGEAAMQLKLLSRETLIKIFGPHFGVDFFNLDANFFPRDTMDFFSKETLVRLGILPLGLKKDWARFKRVKRLNVGVLNPGRKSFEYEIQNHLGGHKIEINTIKFYLILADPFIQVLNKIYGVSEGDLRVWPISQMDDTLKMFLERPA